MGWGGLGITWGEDIPLPAAYQIATGPGIGPLFEDIYAEFDFVLEGNVYRHAQAIGWPGGPWGSWGPWGYGGTLDFRDTLLRYGWRGKTTDDDDNPAHTYIPSALINPVNFEVQIPYSGSKGFATSSFGVVEFAPIDDNDLGYWAGRVFNLKIGGKYNVGLDNEVTLDYNEYVTRYRFVCRDIEYDQEICRLIVKDGLEDLNVPIQQSTYSGSGDYGGNDAVKGEYKPCLYGTCFNVTPVLIDDTNYLYQMNDGALDDIPDVRVNGKSLTDGGDTTNLPGASISAGQYKTDLSRGLFRLGSQPDGAVTADGARATTQGGLVLLEMIDDLGVSEVDRGSFHANLKEDLGFYCTTSATNALSTLNSVVVSADAYVYVSRIGLITLGGHENPREGVTDIELRGQLEGQLNTREQLIQYVLNNSDILDAGWTNQQTPNITTGLTDPYGATNGFRIESDSGSEGRIYGSSTPKIAFKWFGPKVVTAFVKFGNRSITSIGLRRSNNTWAVQAEVNFGAAPERKPGLDVISGSADFYEAAPAPNGWWFIQFRTGNVVAGDEVRLYLWGSWGSGSYPLYTDWAYPCVYERKEGPAYPITLPFDSWQTGTVVTAGESESFSEGNTVDEREAFAFPAYIISIRRIITPPAPKTIKVAYKKNWTIQNEDSLDTTIAQSAKQSYSRANLTTEIVDNDNALTFNPDAPELFVEGGYLATEIDGNAVRDGILGRVGAQRDLFQIEIVAPLFQITIGQLVKIFHDRFQLHNGKIGEVVRIVETSNTTVLDVLIITS